MRIFVYINFLLVLFSLVFSTSSFAAKKKRVLHAHKITQPIVVDGVTESVWNSAKELSVVLDEAPYEPNNGYDGFTKTTTRIRALYDDQYLYMQFRWEDDKKDLNRFPWEKQRDGSWEHLKNLDSTLHENTYYEDKFAVYWDISEKGFKKKGCDKSCHMAEKGMLEGVKEVSAGRHFTLAGYLDEWHWKSTRTNINHQMDDGFVNSERETNKKWGRQTDKKTGGGYYNNVNGSKDQPGWMSERTQKVASTDPIYHLLEKEKIPFEDNFKSGDRLPGIVTTPFEGSRADIEAKGEWKDGEWILEVKRLLITDSSKKVEQEDLQFEDLNKTYYFGVTAFDNSQIAHIYHNGSIQLKFQK